MEKKIQAAVIGHPIEHSKSPDIHNSWLKERGREGEYLKFDVKPEELEDFILNLKDKGLSGINITIPHKEAAYEILKKHGKLTEIAEKIGAINTVYFEGEEMIGTNTDYFGFIEGLKESVPEIKLENKKFLIIGAGGAAKAIISGLILENKNIEIRVVNRGKERLESLKQKFENEIKIGEFLSLEAEINKSEIIVNTTSCGLNGENNLMIDQDKIEKGKIFYDLVYKPEITEFLKNAKEAGHKIVTGIGMLINQAKPGHKKFFG